MKCFSPSLILFLLASITTLSGCSDAPKSETSEQVKSSNEQSRSDATSKSDSNKTENGSTQKNEPQEQFAYVKPPLTEQQLQDGWVSLFDGATLFGWQPNSESAWQVLDGEIECSEGPMGLLLTPFEVDDFELKCDFWLERGGNSGIFLRTLADPKKVDADCYELNLCDTHEAFPTASLVGRRKCEPVPQVEGEWHTFHIRMEGPRINVDLDGESVVDFTDETPGLRNTGHIGLQRNAGQIKFRNILLRPIRRQPLLNESDLTGWSVVPGSKGEFIRDADELRIAGGAGFLETDQTYDDFVLQFETRTGVADTNSGVFFRAEKGTEEAPSNGYELQICNSVADGDRTQPNDYGTGWGTGAIFRFAKARWVVPDDEQWFHMTLIAQGDQFATFVNGYPVASWKDTREPNVNPRRGRRLDAGHISLQGHDEGTRVAFRNLSIQTMNREAD